MGNRKDKVTLKKAFEELAAATKATMDELEESLEGSVIIGDELAAVTAIMAEMKAKEITAGVGEWVRGLTSLDPILEGEPLALLQIVYYKEEGWRRVPLRVVEII